MGTNKFQGTNHNKHKIAFNAFDKNNDKFLKCTNKDYNKQMLMINKSLNSDQFTIKDLLQ